MERIVVPLFGRVWSGTSSAIAHCSSLSESVISTTLNTVGASFSSDVNNINGGYPVLKWENEKYNN